MNFAVVVSLLAAAVQVYALPDGAPAVACVVIFPLHVVPPNQVRNVTANPYQLSLQGFLEPNASGYRYFPGALYTRKSLTT